MPYFCTQYLVLLRLLAESRCRDAKTKTTRNGWPNLLQAPCYLDITLVGMWASGQVPGSLLARSTLTGTCPGDLCLRW